MNKMILHSRKARVLLVTGVAVGALMMGGCSTLSNMEPDSASVVLTHVSHLSQHAPISNWVGEPTTNYGYQTASVAAQWQHKNLYWSVAEGIQLPGGDLSGPHEVFSASVGYTFWHRK